MTAEEIAAVVAAAAHENQFSGAVRITIDRGAVFEAAYGRADRSHWVANTVDTRFSVASGGKLFTALGIGTLIDDGVLEFATRLSDVLSVPLPKLSRPDDPRTPLLEYVASRRRH